VRLLLDEMFSPALRDALTDKGITAVHVRDIGLAGAPDAEVFRAAQEARYALLTENLVDFLRIAADYAIRGDHHHGLVISLSTRFARRAAGVPALVRAIAAIGGDDMTDQIRYLQRIPGETPHRL
jgi:hypothetical protein